MEHQKVLNLLNEAGSSLPIVNQIQIMMWETKLSII